MVDWEHWKSSDQYNSKWNKWFCFFFSSQHNEWGTDVGQMPVYFHDGHKDWQVFSMNNPGQKNSYQC